MHNIRALLDSIGLLLPSVRLSIILLNPCFLPRLLFLRVFNSPMQKSNAMEEREGRKHTRTNRSSLLVLLITLPQVSTKLNFQVLVTTLDVTTFSSTFIRVYPSRFWNTTKAETSWQIFRVSDQDTRQITSSKMNKRGIILSWRGVRWNGYIETMPPLRPTVSRKFD